MNQQLVAILADSGTMSSHDLDLTLRQAAARNMSLWDVLVHDQRVPEETLARALATRLNLPRVHIDAIEIEAAAVRTLSAQLARKHTCLPIRLKGKYLVVAMMNPLDHEAKQDVQFASNRQVEPVVACRSEILSGIEKHYPSTATRAPESQAPDAGAVSGALTGRDDLDLEFDEIDGRRSGDAAPAVQLCKVIIGDAMALGASDIHIEPGACEMRVRLRVDGVLRDHSLVPRWLHAGVVSRIKILAKLDISQQRLPQDGRITLKRGGRDVDLRVSTLPTHLGEKVVMRLLGSATIPALHALGLSAQETETLDSALNQPQGLILVTGPTGAGKSTTLYSMLTRRQSSELNIVTIEDPIEYQVPGASQVQVDVKAGLTFASCLRSILRQDPDLILVGEIRDLETAEIAFQAALTGHLVFSTLHTNSSLGAIERLLDLGVRPLVIASATNLIIAQRLARRLCTHCREPYAPSADALRTLDLDADSHEFHRGRGCSRCAHTGYAGRVGIFEILTLTPRLKELITRQAGEAELRRAATAAGTRLLLADAVRKVRQGLTTVEEVLRVVRIERADSHIERRRTRSSGLAVRRPGGRDTLG
jgi:type IV pilus assembly protein PilB